MVGSSTFRQQATESDLFESRSQFTQKFESRPPYSSKIPVQSFISENSLNKDI